MSEQPNESEDDPYGWEDMLVIFQRAVRKAQEENRRLGIANVHEGDDKLIFELPSGELTTIDPETGKEWPIPVRRRTRQ